jgi:hypothetical protein
MYPASHAGAKPYQPLWTLRAAPGGHANSSSEDT